MTGGKRSEYNYPIAVSTPYVFEYTQRQLGNMSGSAYKLLKPINLLIRAAICLSVVLFFVVAKGEGKGEGKGMAKGDGKGQGDDPICCCLAIILYCGASWVCCIAENVTGKV